MQNVVASLGVSVSMHTQDISRRNSSNKIVFKISDMFNQEFNEYMVMNITAGLVHGHQLWGFN